MNTPDLVKATLINALQTHLGNICRVTPAWPASNKPIGDTPILAIEALTPREDLAPAEVTHLQDPAPGIPTAAITLDTGNAQLSLHANLFVADPTHGRGRRSQILRRIQSFFFPLPGNPSTRTLNLDEIPGNRATYHIEEVRDMDDPNHVPLGEFRAIVRFEARYPLLHQTTATIATQINLLSEDYPNP